MHKPLTSLNTTAGLFQLGSRASTRYPEPRAGLVTAIRQAGAGHTIELNGVHSAGAEYFTLDAAPEPVAEALLAQHVQGVSAGIFEVRLPAEIDRIIFCQTPEQVIALLARTIGVRDPAEELACLVQAAQRGPLDEKRWRGAFGIVGQLAYVSSARQRPAPRFAVGDTISAYTPQDTYRVEGIQLLCDVYNRRGFGSLGEWHYLVGGPRSAHPVPESNVAATAAQGANLAGAQGAENSRLGLAL
jgi:hypothetical protein